MQPQVGADESQQTQAFRCHTGHPVLRICDSKSQPSKNRVAILCDDHLPQPSLSSHSVLQAPVLTTYFLHNDFSIYCKWFARMDIFPAHVTLLPCQGLAENWGILAPSPSPLLLLSPSARNWGLTVFTSQLFREMGGEPMYPDSKVLLPMVGPVTFGLLFNWRNVVRSGFRDVRSGF